MNLDAKKILMGVLAVALAKVAVRIVGADRMLAAA